MKINKPNLRIVYKSGHVQDVYCKSFSYKEDGSGMKLKWNHLIPRPLKIGNINDIESIWDLDPQYVEDEDLSPKIGV